VESKLEFPYRRSLGPRVRPVMSPRDPHGSTLSCTLLCGASEVSLAQLFTGFALLEQRGVVDVRLKDTRGTPLPGNWWGMGMVTDDGQRVVYDTGDGPQLNAGALGWCDYYFKRSYSAGVAEHVVDVPLVHAG